MLYNRGEYMHKGPRMLEKMPDGWRDVLGQLLPVLAGTAVSMFFLNGAWKRRLVQGLIGVPFGFYMAPFASRLMASWDWPITDSEAGALAGAFGIAFVSYVHEVMQQLQLGTVLREAIAARLGGKK